MANTTTSEVPQAVNYFYNKTMLSRAVPYLVHTKFGQVRDIPRNNGTAIKFRRYGSLAAATTALTEGTTPSGKQLSVTDITATVSQYGDFVTLTDVLVFSTFDPILTETAEVLGEQAGDTLDQLARDVLAAGTTVQYAGTATSRATVDSTMKLDVDEIREAVLTLQENNARPITTMVDASTGYNTTPIGRCYVGIIHPRTLRDLKSDSNFIPVEKYANTKVLLGDEEVGKIDEVRFVMSTNAKVFSGAGASGIDVYATIVFGRDFYGISRISTEALRNIVKPLGSAGSADPLDQRATSGWKATFVAKILNESFGVRIEHAVS